MSHGDIVTVTMVFNRKKTFQYFIISDIRGNGQVSLLVPKNKRASLAFFTNYFPATFNVILMRNLI